MFSCKHVYAHLVMLIGCFVNGIKSKAGDFTGSMLSDQALPSTFASTLSVSTMPSRG
jgi:hypothetical protein